jgi:hypothetical protein
MDPLSIIASSITLVGASISASEVIVSFISGIRNLPTELRSTSQDVADFRTLLVELESSIRLEEILLQSLGGDGSAPFRAIADGIPAASREGFERIERVKSKLTEIETSVKKISEKEFLGKLKLLERKKLQVLRQDLRDIKLGVSAHFSAKSGYVYAFTGESFGFLRVLISQGVYHFKHWSPCSIYQDTCSRPHEMLRSRVEF